MIFFEHIVVAENEKLIKFNAIEDESEVGSCYLSLVEDFALINNIISINNSVTIAEGLIRSALNYAANRGFYIARCNQNNITGVLTAMNFELTDNGYENDIPTILKGSCSCCKCI